MQSAPTQAAQAPQFAIPQDAEPDIAALRLARSRNVGPRSFARLIRRFGTAAEALGALPELAARGGERDYEPYPEAAAAREIEAGARAGARLVTLGESAYPPLLAAIGDPPPVVWVLGRLDVLHRSAVAVVGARNASAPGLRTARRIARDLGEAGLVIVSGLARGIDTAAHRASLDTGTVAVMAGGVDIVYPEENRELAAEILDRGALISECPMGTEPTSRHFPRRNRLISGLATGVVLVEAAERSGSLITARYALEQGREAMACPGAPDDPRAGGCNQLIRDGAALIRHAGDVSEALSLSRIPGLAEPGSEFAFAPEDFEDFDDMEALADFDEEGGEDGEALSDQILRLLGPHPVEIDEVARQCGVAPSALSLPLLELELAGNVEVRPGGTVVLAAD